jgi:hypothetical protein
LMKRSDLVAFVGRVRNAMAEIRDFHVEIGRRSRIRTYDLPGV